MRSSLFNLPLRWLLILSSFLLVTACNGAQNNLNPSESNMLAQTTKFQYSINVGYPNGYDVIYERTQSYFMDAQGEPIIYFGGRIAAGGGWGYGAQNTSVSAQNVMPASFKVRWFSPTENQFWEGEFKLSQQELYQMVKEGYRNVFNPNGQATYSDFTINVAPGGLVVLWMGGGAQTRQVGEFQAHKIEVDWQEFARNTFIYAPDKKRAEYISEVIDNDYAIGQVRQEIKTRTLPTDSALWKLLQRKYLWRMQLDSPFVLKDFRAWYANAESFYTYADKVNDYQNSAVPYKIFFTFQKPDQQMDQIMLVLDKPKIIEAYKKLDGSQYHKLDLYLKLSADLSHADVYLKNKDEEIKLDIKEVYLDDL